MQKSSQRNILHRDRTNSESCKYLAQKLRLVESAECMHCILGISLKIQAVRAVCLYGRGTPVTQAYALKDKSRKIKY
jgi:hypothetical protein